MHSDRSPYASPDIRGGTMAEKSAAADTFVSYAGTFSLGAGTVTHHIDLSLFPNWVGTHQQRFIEVEVDRLELRTPPFQIYGREQKAYLVWDRPNRKLNRQPSNDTALIGVWRLVSCVQMTDGGDVDYPYGDDPLGYLMYGDDGYFAVIITRVDRSRYASDDFRGGSTEEKARAVETFASYCGQFTFDGDVVTHHVEASLYPNWVGTDQRRLVELDGDRLLLSTSPMLVNGKMQRAHLLWQRAGSCLDHAS